MKYCFLLLAALVLTTHSARAQREEPDTRSLSLTISPVHLMLPVFEVTGEFKVAPKMGMAAIFGIGSATVTTLDERLMMRSHTFSVLELGASYRYYLIGDFDHGMQLGIEMLYANIAGDFEEYDVSGVGNGLAVGPFAGYKLAMGFGLTIELQGGAGFMLVSAKATDNATGQQASGSGGGLIPIVNINAGWTF